jgi:hypothetical protein
MYLRLYVDVVDSRAQQYDDRKGAYTAVNHKVTVVNGPYFTRLASTVLRPFVDVSYTIKNDEKRLFTAGRF